MSDFLGQLNGKVLELKKRRDGISSEMNQERMMMTQLEEQIINLQSKRQQVKMSYDEKEMQIRKYNELIEQSEGAVNKMMSNTQKLNDALNSALTEDKF